MSKQQIVKELLEDLDASKEYEYRNMPLVFIDSKNI